MTSGLGLARQHLKHVLFSEGMQAKSKSTHIRPCVFVCRTHLWVLYVDLGCFSMGAHGKHSGIPALRIPAQAVGPICFQVRTLLALTCPGVEVLMREIDPVFSHPWL